MSIELLKQALEALESLFNGQTDQNRAERCSNAITSLRQAIAEAEKDDPVAFVIDRFQGQNTGSTMPEPQVIWIGRIEIGDKLYTHPQQRKPLTDAAIATVYWGATGQSLRPQDNVLAHKFARAIETAHGIKENT